jgi:hypothetical protein
MHNGPINMIRYSYLGNMYVTCGVDGSVKVIVVDEILLKIYSL